MGVQLPGSGGRGRNVNADLNLVPFIDLLCTTITFLLATAVWTQTEVLPVTQEVGTELIDDFREAPPPLTLHIRADGAWLGRSVTEGQNYPLNGGAYDWEAVEAALKIDRDAFPDERMVIINTDDGVRYEHVVRALDLSRFYGYDAPLLAGGPAKGSAKVSG